MSRLAAHAYVREAELKRPVTNHLLSQQRNSGPSPAKLAPLGRLQETDSLSKVSDPVKAWPGWAPVGTQSAASLPAPPRMFDRHDVIKRKQDIRREVSAISDAPGHGQLFAPHQPPSNRFQTNSRLAPSGTSSSFTESSKCMRSSLSLGALGSYPGTSGRQPQLTCAAACEPSSPSASRVNPTWNTLPSNRSDAAALLHHLDELLLSAKRDFRAEFSAYNTVLAELTRQVGVHCAERGEVMRRVSEFYIRSTHLTARMAERSVEAKLGEKIAALEEENRKMGGELKQTRKQLRSYVGESRSATEMVLGLFSRLEPSEKQAALRACISSGAETLMRDAHGFVRLPSELVSELEPLFVCLEPVETSLLLTEITSRQPQETQIKVFHSLLQSEHEGTTLLQVVSEKLEPDYIRSIFCGTSGRSSSSERRDQLVANLLHSSETDETATALRDVMRACPLSPKAA